MKKLVFSLLAIFFVTLSAQAQDPAKALKKAGAALTAFNVDPSANLDKLNEAVDMINTALTSDEIKATSKAWQLQGDIYNDIASQISIASQLEVVSLDGIPQVDNPAVTAATAYQKALELAEKKYQSKDAIKGLEQAQLNLERLGRLAYQDGDFAGAYKNFNGILVIHDLFAEKGMGTSFLSDEATLNDQLYFTGLAALNANDTKAAAPLFNRLKEAGADKPAIYESLYKIEAAAAFDPEVKLSEEEETALLKKAYPTLAEGREKFPDDVSLLFAEINHFLMINELSVLISKLEMAIEKEPTNISLYSTMGNVYDNLFQNAAKEGDEAKSNEYFDKSLDYYNQALAKDPNFTDATYSIGALYFNRAATMTQSLAALADDFSKEGQKKYETMQTNIKAEFEKALPYFVEVEKKKPSDYNTLAALKEIYARKNDFTLSNEFKARLEAAQAGTALESYFLNN